MNYMAFNHGDNDTTYFSSDSDKLRGFEYLFSSEDESPICIYYRNNEDGALISTGCNTADEFKKMFLKELVNIAKEFKEAYNNGEFDTYYLVDTEINTFYSMIGFNYDYYEDILKLLDNQEDLKTIVLSMYDELMRNLENTYVDGDSSWVVGVVDFRNKKCIVSGGSCYFY